MVFVSNFYNIIICRYGEVQERLLLRMYKYHTVFKAVIIRST